MSASASNGSGAISSPLLDLIRSQGMLDDLQLDEVKEEHNRSGKTISEILQDFGLMDMDTTAPDDRHSTGHRGR